MIILKRIIALWFITTLLVGCATSSTYQPVESIYTRDIRITREELISEKTLYNQQKTINALVDMHHSIIYPISYPNYEFNQIKADVNLDKQFDHFEHISVQDSFTVDFLLYGSPLLYCYKEEPFDNQKDYLLNLKANDLSEIDKPYLNNIRIDGSAEGFFEYVLLEKIGQQFLLMGHANYNDIILIADSLEIDYIEYSINILNQNRREHKSGYVYVDTTFIDKRTLNDSRFRSGSRSIDLNDIEKMELYSLSYPTVSIYSSYVTVEFLSFTKWGGFFRETYYIKKSFPHKILKKSKRSIKGYNCGFRF